MGGSGKKKKEIRGASYMRATPDTSVALALLSASLTEQFLRYYQIQAMIRPVLQIGRLNTLRPSYHKVRNGPSRSLNVLQWRTLVTLAIETSCDDTAVAILEKTDKSAVLWFNEKITADNNEYGGIHPLRALVSHQRNLATLVRKAVETFKQRQAKQRIPSDQLPSPDLVAVTRGPGMRSNLATGIDFAKGLSVAWNVPLVGVHHMQAHLLTPRLIAALGSAAPGKSDDVAFPFLSLLVSGGHTMLLLSRSLTEHNLLADTDLAMGQALDKIARLVVPQSVLDAADSTMYGAVLEKFAFANSPTNDHSYVPPQDSSAAYYRRLKLPDHTWAWSIKPPLADADGGAKRGNMEFSFAGVPAAVERIMKFDQNPSAPTRTPRPETVSWDERRALAREAMRVCFEHLTSRLLMALESSKEPIKTVVLSGGVASNHYLRCILDTWLSSFGHSGVKVSCPPPAYCTDNAAMIAWAGLEMYEAGWRSDLGITARRKWALGMQDDKTRSTVASGQGEDDAIGILDIDGWYNVNETGQKVEDITDKHTDPGPRPRPGLSP